MRTIRIYQAGSFYPDQSYDLSPEASHHLAVVLRIKSDQTIVLFNGNNQEFDAIITHLHKKTVRVLIQAARSLCRESPCNIHLAQAISKGERMEFVVQKSVELGVASILPLLTERSVVRTDEERLEKKRAQWQAIAIAACEQSGRNIIPKVRPIQSLEVYLRDNKEAINFVLHPQGSKTWRDHPPLISSLSLLIGPEGGFSEAELSKILAFNFNPLSLGPRILRTETAALAAISVLQAIYGDL